MTTRETDLILSTTPSIDGQPIRAYLGIVSGGAVLDAGTTKDLFSAVRDVVGGRAAGYEHQLADARRRALDELADAARDLGGHGVVGIDLDYQAVGPSGSVLMVTATGTAVRFHVDEMRPEVEWEHDLRLAPTT